MNSLHLTKLPLRASVLAVQSALAALSLMAMASAARAAEATVAELTTPASTVELGFARPNQAPAKAFEYGGITQPGIYGLFNLDLRGGDAYDSGGTSRWRVTGRDLGTDRRSGQAEVSDQGVFRLDLSYDELLRRRSDSYQTPYLGAGTNRLTLPSTWLTPLVPRVSSTAPALGVSGGANARGLLSDVTNSSALVSGVLTAPTATQLSTAAAIQAADLPLFNKLELSTKRTQYGLGLRYDIDRQWQLSASFSHEDKQGMKPMGTVTRYTNGDMAAIIPDLIDQNTEQINVGLAYVGERLTLNAAYYASLFGNNVASMSWANWAMASNIQTMSSAPSNQFHQLSLSGTYALGSSTKLIGQMAYGRNAQDQAFLTDISTPLVPVSSLHGLLVTESVNLKLVSRPLKNLSVSAAYKFDQRDNRSTVNTYGYYDAGEGKSGTSLFASYFPTAGLGSNANLNANRPYSKRLNQFSLDGDYALGRSQSLKAGAELQKIDRYCTGSWIDCVDASKTSETTLHGEWRINPAESLSARLGLSTAHRTVNYNEDAFLALVPAANLSPTGAPAGSTAYGTLTALGFTGYGPSLGLPGTPIADPAQAFFFANNNALSNALYGNQNRISELPGMRRFNMADRNRDKVRSSLSWQASEEFSLQAGVDLNRDRYTQSVYGLTSAKSTVFNLDGTFSPSDDTSVTLFFSAEDQRSASTGNTYTANSAATAVNTFTAVSGGCYTTIALRNASNKVDNCLNWTADMRDQVNTLGLSLARKNLLGGSLDLSGGLSFSQARSDTNVNGGNYANNPLAVSGAAAGTVAAYYIAATALPTVKTDISEFRLGGQYSFSKQQAIRLGYQWQHLKAVDWAYDGMQFGGLSGVLPTSELAPTYTVQTLSASYVYSFR